MKPIIQIFVIIFFIVFYVIAIIKGNLEDDNRIKKCTKYCKENRKLLISGKVIDKRYVGNNSKGVYTVFILQNKIDTIDYYSSFHENLNFVNIGDSIFKKAGTFNFFIFRENKLIHKIISDSVDCECVCAKSFKECE